MYSGPSATVPGATARLNFLLSPESDHTAPWLMVSERQWSDMSQAHPGGPRGGNVLARPGHAEGPARVDLPLSEQMHFEWPSPISRPRL